MPGRSFDVVILGGGNAGMGVTVATREAGLSVAMIEPDLLGGTCPNRGCMPKKVLVAAAHALDEIDRAPAHHIAVGKPTLDWAALIDREKAMIAGIPGSLEQLMQRRGVEVIRGHGRFTAPHTIAVNDDVLEAKHVVIATGSTPRRLPFPGAELMITSNEVLSARALPPRVAFVGGGVIAMEFGHVYARAGSQVTILEMAPRLLPGMDADAVMQLHRETERIGVAVRTGVEIGRIEHAGEGLRVVYRHDGDEHAIEADRVVNGAGRVPNIDGLDLAAGQVASERGSDLRGCPFALDIEPGGLCVRGCGRDKSATVADRDVRRADRWPQHRRWPEARTRLHQHSCVRLYGAGACQRGVDTGHRRGAGDRSPHRGQRYAELAVGTHLRRDGRMGKGIDRQADRSDRRRPYFGARRRGVDPHLRAGHEKRHQCDRHQRPDLRLPDIFGRHQIAVVSSRSFRSSSRPNWLPAEA